MSRKSCFALLLLVLVAIPAATARAAVRMPVGFYDDPSFRWSPAVSQNLAAAQKANGSIIHVLADWSQIAPTKPSSPLNGSDPAYNLSDLDTLIRAAQSYNFQILLTIPQTPKWANGGQTPNHPPTNLNNLTQFAQMLATRYNGSHGTFGIVNRFSVWNEPNLQLFLTPQFSGKTIVSPGIYAKLFRAAYKGIKAGNPRAIVAAGETSNRGHNHPTGGVSDSVAPATFARLLSEADPKLPFDAWATHPYPSVYSLGPTQKVAFPNVALSTMTKFGSSLQQWFHRRVPIWITEYAEQTKPEYAGGVSYAQQAADAKKALQLAAANPYVEMFVWFIFRDSTAQTWFSGLETKSGGKKPAYSSFAATAKSIDGDSMFIAPGKAFKVTVAVPFLANRDVPGAHLGMTYQVLLGRKKVASGTPGVVMQSDGTVTFTVAFDPVKGKSYTMTTVANDKGGQLDKRTIALLPAP